MNTSTTIIAVWVQLLAVFLPMFGIKLGSDQLTIAAQTIAVILSGLYIWIERVRKGDIKWFGGRKPKFSYD